MSPIAVLLLIAPLVNAYFLWHGLHLYRKVKAARPVLLALVMVKIIVWLVGLFTAVLVVISLYSPPRPLTPTGLAFGIALLLIQGLPLFIHVQMRRIERGA